MSVKKSPIPISSARTFRKELDELYARRHAIDSLIESLEEYDRFREKSTEEDGRKTA
jgi:hypothetical protein